MMNALGARQTAHQSGTLVGEHIRSFDRNVSPESFRYFQNIHGTQAVFERAQVS